MKLTATTAFLFITALLGACSDGDESSLKGVENNTVKIYRKVLENTKDPRQESISELILSINHLRPVFLRVDETPSDILEPLKSTDELNGAYMPQPTEYLALLLKKRPNNEISEGLTKAVSENMDQMIKQAEEELLPWIENTQKIIANRYISEVLAAELPPVCPVGKCAKIQQLPDRVNFGGYFSTLWLYLLVASPDDVAQLTSKMTHLSSKAEEAYLLFEELKPLKVAALEARRRQNPIVDEPKKNLNMKDLGELAGEAFKESKEGVEEVSDNVKRVFKPISDFAEGFSEGAR